jgi:hypothetical protein
LESVRNRTRPRATPAGVAANARTRVGKAASLMITFPQADANEGFHRRRAAIINRRPQLFNRACVACPSSSCR